MTKLISNATARDAIIADVLSARDQGRAGVADGETSRTLKRGRKALFVYGSELQIVLIANDGYHGFDILRFYNADGVLAHEEAAGEDRLARIGLFE
jgi:hypothetical protein